MYRFERLVFPETAEEAYEKLREGRNNVVLGGGCWLALGEKRYQTAIDLSRLGLARIEEESEALYLGASLTLRQMETDPISADVAGGLLKNCVAPIVGVQLRNMATLGGSVYSRFGFSDILCALTALECMAELHAGGSVPLEDFMANGPRGRDLLLAVRIKKENRLGAMETMRLSACDFPALTVAVSHVENRAWHVAIGARPGRAVRSQGAEAMLDNGVCAQDAAACAARETAFADNRYASAAYRAILAQTLCARAISAARAKGGYPCG